MSEETIIGPQRCHQCGGEYGEHDSGCTESKEHKELTRLRAELATARSERDELKLAYGKRVKEINETLLERDESRRTVERLRTALISVEHLYGPQFSSVTASLVRHAIVTTPSAEPVVPEGELLLQLVAMTNQAEALALELEWLLAYQARTPNNSRAREALAAFRAKRPPAEATARMP